MTPAITKLSALRELWFHTGTACNLECPFCLEGSKPGDTRLQRVTLTDLKPHIDAAVTLNVERFVFTGGEPLIVKDIVKILSYALELKPCLVLTNGTAPLIKRAHQLQSLKAHPNTLSFRVSIDRPDEKLHDTERGWGNFKRAIEGMKLLAQAGFEISVARQTTMDEDRESVAAHYRDLLAKNGLPPELTVVPWPEFGRPGAGPEVAPPTAKELADSPHNPMCRTSRLLLKRDNQVRVYACALTNDDAQFEVGTSLSSSLEAAVTLTHSRCGQCVRRGANLG